MIYKCKIQIEDKEEDVYLYVNYEDEDGDFYIQIDYNKRLYTEIENLQIEYHLDKYYEEIRQDIIKTIQTVRK